MCLGTDVATATSPSAKRKRHAPVYIRRPTMIPPPIRPSSPRSVVGYNDATHVSFDESSNQVHEIPTMLSLLGESNNSNSSKEQLWYAKADLKNMRRTAHDLANKSRLSEEPQDDSEDETLRGLEARMSPERQHVKSYVVRRVLEAQEDDCDASEMAEISLKLSTVSRETAKYQAEKDYLEVFRPNSTSSSALPQLPAVLDCRRKRSLLVEQQGITGRRVRVRMF